MTDGLKALIEKAPIKRAGKFRNFLIVPTGEKYDGFWGENGYNNIILLWQAEDGEFYNITDSADAIMFVMIKVVNFDVPTEYNCVRFWFDDYIEIRNELDLSAISGYPEGSMEK